MSDKQLRRRLFLCYRSAATRLNWPIACAPTWKCSVLRFGRTPREIRAGKEWEDQIVDGLRGTQVVIALLSPQAVRRSTDPNSPDYVDCVCLDELTFAGLK